MEYERSDAVDDRVEWLRTYGYGLCMGTADALPGVSGGTVALLLGFYGRLIAAVTAFTPWRAAAVLRGYHPDQRTKAREALLELDLGFLLPLGVGIITAVVVVADARNRLEVHVSRCVSNRSEKKFPPGSVECGVISSGVKCADIPRSTD